MSEIQLPVAEFNDYIKPHQLEVLRHFDEHPEIRIRGCVWHRRARKTSMALNLLIRESAKNKNQTYNYIGPSFRQAKAITWIDPAMIRRFLPPQVLRKEFNESELRGYFKSGSTLNIGGADDPDRWRGTGGYGWVLDEFSVMRNGKEMYEEIIYPIIKENGGWVLFLYTPKGRNHGWEYYQKALKNPSWKFWMLKIGDSGIFSDEAITEIKSEMPEQLFQQEFNCDFLVGGGGIIKRIDEAIAGALQPALRGRRYVMGVDLGKSQDWTVLSVLNCETKHLDAFQRFQKIDWSFQKEKIALLAKQYNNALIVIDSTGLGDPIEEDLARMGLSVRGVKFTQNSRKQLVEKLILSIEDRRITFPKVEDLINELRDFDIDEKGKYNAPSGLHDDCVFSLALAVDGLGSEIYSVNTAEVYENSYVSYSERFRGANA